MHSTVSILLGASEQLRPWIPLWLFCTFCTCSSGAKTDMYTNVVMFSLSKVIVKKQSKWGEWPFKNARERSACWVLEPPLGRYVDAHEITWHFVIKHFKIQSNNLNLAYKMSSLCISGCQALQQGGRHNSSPLGEISPDRKCPGSLSPAP